MWLSVDPLVEETMDAYGYVHQNPIRLIDPSGMSAEDCPDCPNGIYDDGTDHLSNDGNTYSYDGSNNRWSDLGNVTITGKPKATGTTFEGSAQGLHLVESETGSGGTINGYRVEGQISGKYGKLNGEFSGFSIGAEGSHVSGEEVHGSFDAYGMNAQGGIRLGTNDNNIAIEGTGSIFKAEGKFDAGIYTGINNKYGTELGIEAGVYMAEGNYTPSISIFGYKLGFNIGGSAGSAHIGGRGSATYDNESKEVDVSLMGHIGLGAGVRLGFSISNTSQEINKKQ